MSEHIYRHKPLCEDLNKAATDGVKTSERYTNTHMEDLRIHAEAELPKDEKAFYRALVLETLG